MLSDIPENVEFEKHGAQATKTAPLGFGIFRYPWISPLTLS
jgi:hypothetical protein